MFAPVVKKGVVVRGDKQAGRLNAGYPHQAIGVVVQVTHGLVAKHGAGQHLI